MRRATILTPPSRPWARPNNWGAGFWRESRWSSLTQCWSRDSWRPRSATRWPSTPSSRGTTRPPSSGTRRLSSSTVTMTWPCVPWRGCIWWLTTWTSASTPAWPSSGTTRTTRRPPSWWRTWPSGRMTTSLPCFISSSSSPRSQIIGWLWPVWWKWWGELVTWRMSPTISQSRKSLWAQGRLWSLVSISVRGCSNGILVTQTMPWNSLTKPEETMNGDKDQFTTW